MAVASSVFRAFSLLLFLSSGLLQISAEKKVQTAAIHQDVANPVRFLNWTPPHAASVSAFVHVNVIPMRNTGIQRDFTVVIRDGRIAAIGPSGSTPTPLHAQVIDAKSKYLIPGLIDMRVRIYNPGELLMYLANGVTTVRNLDGRPQHLFWRDQINSGKMLGPTILTAGPILDSVGTAAEATKLVLEESRAGYDAVEVGGDVPAEAFRATAASARAFGVLLFGPVNTHVGLKGTVHAPQFFSVEQVGHYSAVLFKGNPATPEESISEAAVEIRDAKLWFVPSLASSANAIQKEQDLPGLLGQPGIRYLSPWVRREWSSPHHSWPENGHDEKAALSRNVDFEKKIVSVMHREKVPMILGTDSMTLGSVPGFSAHQELANLVESGCTPFEALEAATRNASDWFVHPEGGGVFGTITLGERADFVLLDADPLADVGNVSKIRGVMVQGRWLPKIELQRMLEALPVAYSAEEKFLASITQSDPRTLNKYLHENDPFHKLTNEVMLELVTTKGVEALKQLYRRLQGIDRTSMATEETTVDDLGVRLLDLNRDSEAIGIFSFNVQQHPSSAKAYDSLAQANLKSGNRTKAIEYFKGALRVDPSYEHARYAVQQLESDAAPK